METWCLHPTWRCYPSGPIWSVTQLPALPFTPITTPNVRIIYVCAHCGAMLS